MTGDVDHRRQYRRVVGAVGVDLGDGLVAPVEGHAEAIQVGTGQPELRRPFEEAHAFAEGRVIPNETARPVCGVVVHDQHVGIGEPPDDLIHDSLDVVGLVVRRDDDQGTHRGRNLPRGWVRPEIGVSQRIGAVGIVRLCSPWNHAPV